MKCRFLMRHSFSSPCPTPHSRLGADSDGFTVAAIVVARIKISGLAGGPYLSGAVCDAVHFRDFRGGFHLHG